MKAAPGRRCNWVSTLGEDPKTASRAIPPAIARPAGDHTRVSAGSGGASGARVLQPVVRVIGLLAPRRTAASEDQDALVGDRPAVTDDVEPAVEVARHGAEITDQHRVGRRVDEP
jgi:hypothetical protein